MPRKKEKKTTKTKHNKTTKARKRKKDYDNPNSEEQLSKPAGRCYPSSYQKLKIKPPLINLYIIKKGRLAVYEKKRRKAR